MLKNCGLKTQPVVLTGYLVFFLLLTCPSKLFSLQADFSCVEHELARLFNAQGSSLEKNSKIAQMRFFARPVISYLKETGKQAPAMNYFSPLSTENCLDLRLIAGDADFENESFMQKTATATTSVGQVHLACMLTNPIFSVERLTQRKEFLKLLAGKENLVADLQSIVTKFDSTLKTFIQVAGSEAEDDPTCLLNKFFGFYWQNKTAWSLLPKKTLKEIDKLAGKKDKRKKKTGSWLKTMLRPMDKSNTLLNIGFCISATLLLSHWFSQVTGCTRKLEDVFQWDFLKKLTTYFTLEGLPPSPTWKASLDIEKERFWTALEQRRSLPALNYGIRYVHGLSKPVYLFFAPAFIALNIYRQSALYRIAIARALREFSQMGLLVSLSAKLLETIETYVQNNPESEKLFKELDLLPGLYKLLKTDANPELSSLLKELQKPGGITLRSFLINPGKFLRLYRQLYEQISNFYPAICTLGQVDALLAIVKLSKNPGYSFADFNEGHSVMIEDFWDPKIGKEKAVVNSAYFDASKRGMVIAGSNAAGKSSYIGTFGCNIAMAQSFCLVAASKADISPFTNFFIFMNKKDAPARGMSLFKVEATVIGQLFKLLSNLNDGDQLLILIDELFNSTSDTDAYGLICGVVEELARCQQSFTMLSSHTTGISSLQELTNGIFQNFKVTVVRDQQGNFMGYSRKIVPGSPTRADSTALDVAGQSGIPSHVLSRAKAIISSKE